MTPKPHAFNTSDEHCSVQELVVSNSSAADSNVSDTNYHAFFITPAKPMLRPFLSISMFRFAIIDIYVRNSDLTQGFRLGPKPADL